MSVGGRVIENIGMNILAGQYPGKQQDVRRLWVVDRNGDETAVYAEPAAEALELGENIWWQAGVIYARNDTLQFRKIAYSFDRRRSEAE